MGTLSTRKQCRSDTGSGIPRLHLDLHALVLKEMHTRVSMHSSTPVVPEDQPTSDSEWMQEHTYLAWFRGLAPVPLALVAQGTRTATANTSCVHHA